MKIIILGLTLTLLSSCATQFHAHGPNNEDKNNARNPSQIASANSDVRLLESVYNPIGRKLCAWKVTYKDTNTFYVSPVANQLYEGSKCSSSGAHEFNCINNKCTSKYNGYLDMGTIELFSGRTFVQTVNKDAVVYELGQ